MSFNKLAKTILSVVSITSVASSIAMAQLVPGPGHGGGSGGRPPQYDPCDVPSDPNCRPQRPPNRPPQPGRPPAQPGYPSDPYPGYPSNPYPGQGQQSNIIRTVGYYRAVNNQSIDLRRLAGLDYRYNGYRIVSVSASTTPNSPYRTVAQLLFNGYKYDEQVNPGHEIYLRPYNTVRLNSSGSNNLILRILGSTYIDQIRIELSRY
jgi:hypothetical protein